MFASLSSEAVVDRTKRELKLTDTFLARLTDISAPIINLWLNGQRQIGDARALRLEQCCRDLQKIADLCAPWPLSYRDANLWKELLENYRQANAVVRKEE